MHSLYLSFQKAYPRVYRNSLNLLLIVRLLSCTWGVICSWQNFLCVLFCCLWAGTGDVGTTAAFWAQLVLGNSAVTALFHNMLLTFGTSRNAKCHKQCECKVTHSHLNHAFQYTKFLWHLLFHLHFVIFFWKQLNPIIRSMCIIQPAVNILFHGPGPF
jgi:hypothetical protein